MSRRSNRSQPNVALFPFLAVLLCTMGSLILLLLLIARQARTQAEEERQAAEAKLDRAAVEAEREQFQWRVDKLSKSRDQTLADLGETRSLLSHLEEHMLRLRQQIVDAETALRLLDQQHALDDGRRVRLKQDLVDLRKRIAEAEAKLKEAEKAGKKPQAFAIVPFDGQGATRRRPIYIECRADEIVLQPEGIVFHEADFLGSLSPANPLASAVRAAGEHIARTGGLRSGEQPYPLLLVRPSGIPAYYAARAAMSSWDSEFGYELVNEDWPLEYPPADPQLAQLLTQAVEEARLRQTMLARAAPKTRNQPTNATFGVSRTGHGIERIGGDDAADVGPRRGTGVAGAKGFGSGPRFGGDTEQDRPAGGNGLGESGRGNGGWGSSAGSSTAGSGSAASGGTGTRYGGTRNQPSQQLAAADSDLQGGPMLGGPGGNAPAGSRGGYGSAGPGGGSSARGNSGSRGSSERNGGRGSSGSGGESREGVAGGSAAQGSTTGGNGGGNGTSGGSGGSGSSMGGLGGASSSDPTSDVTAAQMPNVSLMSETSADVESMARTRGKDWGLPNKSANSTGLTRPIQIYCASDRITVFSERGGEQIMMTGRTADAVDELVSNVWSQVDTWGLAGRGMYWKPVLSMHVAPDGVHRYTELRTLLEGSGLEVTGKPLTASAPATRYR